MTKEHVIAGKWQQVKLQILKTWTTVTEDELEQTQRDIRKVIGLVQLCSGLAHDQVRKKIKTYISLTDLFFENESDGGQGCQAF